jgi:hypothetical protein
MYEGRSGLLRDDMLMDGIITPVQSSIGNFNGSKKCSLGSTGTIRKA